MHNLTRVIVWRIAQAAFVLFVISWLTFWLLAATGGDAVSVLNQDGRLPAITVEKLRAVYALDQPMGVRYARWLRNIMTGDFGFSFYYQAPVTLIILPRLARTIILTLTAFLIACVTGMTLGILPRLIASTNKQSASRIILRRITNTLTNIFIVLAAAMPRLVLALFVLALVSGGSQTFITPDATIDSTNTAGELILTKLVAAAFVLALPLIAVFVAQTRDGLLTVLAEDFVRVARAKGLTERRVILGHALRPMLNPLLSIGGTSFGTLMSGSVIVESVFGWNGIGALIIIAVRSRDVALLMGIVLITATCVLIGNLCADILVRLNDPRVRASAASFKPRLSRIKLHGA